MQDFRNLEVWQVAHRLTLMVYRMTMAFPSHERFGITSQLRRAASSIATNIAEGCVRRTDVDFARFLYMSIGSASEVEYLLLLSRDLEYLDSESYQEAIEETQRCKRMLASFIRTLSGSSSTLISTLADSRQPRAESPTV